MTKVEYDRLVERENEEHLKNIEALERVWRMSQSPTCHEHNGAATPAPAREQAGDREQFNRGELIKMVREVIPGLKRKFTIIGVEKVLERRHPGKNFVRASLAGTLRRLTENGELVIAQAGAGRRPTSYSLGRAHKEDDA